ncbi:MAG: SprB repeat-containing protein [Flavobacteriales bacterium]|nr:SprB repeat-containing protein [Flavobacteriales bacterium]
MKTLLAIITLAVSSFISFGQITGPENTELFIRPPSAERATQGWYNYGAQVIDLGGNYSYYRNNMFPDSTVVVEFSGGYGPVWKHSMGQVFDPSSVYFDAIGTGHPTIDNQTSYQIDSIGLWHRYFRHQDIAPDTLLIQVYHNDDINFSINPGWSSGASYASVAYDYTIRKGANSMLEIEYLLTNDDSATDGQGFLSLPVGIRVDAGEKIAVTYTYFSGNPYNVGDTIDQYATVPPVNPINAFIVYEVRDEAPYVEPEFYNHELRVTTSVRYNTNTNGWNGDYIPGTAYASVTASTPSIYHLDVEFHATTCDPIISEYTNSNATCGGTDGISTINITAGNAPYSYLWESGNTTVNETGLAAGVHTITVTDSFGCWAIVQAVVNNTMIVDVTVTNVLCNGDANGSVLLASGNCYAIYLYVVCDGFRIFFFFFANCRELFCYYDRQCRVHKHTTT